MTDTLKTIVEIFIIPIIAALAAYLAADLKASAARKTAAATREAEKVDLDKQATELKTQQEASAAALEQRQKEFMFNMAQEWQHQLTETRTKLTATQEQLARETERSNGQERTLGELNQAKESMNTEMLRLRDAKNSADQEIGRLAQDLVTRSHANQETAEQNAQLLKERGEFITEIATLTERLAAVQKEVAELKEQHHKQREEWAVAEVPRQQTLARIRFALKEVAKLLSDDQKIALDKALADKDLTFDSLMAGSAESEPPGADERVQQLRHMNDFRLNENKALITLLSDHSITQGEIDSVLRKAHERWQPPDVQSSEALAILRRMEPQMNLANIQISDMRHEAAVIANPNNPTQTDADHAVNLKADDNARAGNSPLTPTPGPDDEPTPPGGAIDPTTGEAKKIA